MKVTDWGRRTMQRNDSRCEAGRNRSPVARLSLCFSLSVLASLVTLPALAESPGSGPPELFAPGIVSGPANDGSPTFTRDGHTLLFTRSGAGAGTILESHQSNKQWTAP